ncbi:MAG: O-antigen ligase family protein [Sphingomonadales bacterium]|nr:O-antigen ligase family protein [Sphingomonadales bacterium]
MGLRRPFLWVLCYLYVDIVAPQKFIPILAGAPLSFVTFMLAGVAWALVDRGAGTRFTPRQGLILLLLVWCALTTHFAQFPAAAATKWAWVWKALVFAIFLPLTLRTRLRIEAAALVMVLSAAAIVVSGALKTLTSGGGYGLLHFFVNDNTGLYEGSTLSMAAIAIIPLILWLAKFGTILPPSKPLRLAAWGLVACCLLIPVGTVARTGLICAGLLAVVMLRSVRRRALYLVGLAGAVLLALPLLPASYTERMGTIGHHEADESASTRVAVWKWTLGYVAEHPLGGGFQAYLGNHLKIETRGVDSSGAGSVEAVNVQNTTDNARAFHSAYFEMLGEQGWPGLALWLTLQISGLVQLESVQRRLRRAPLAIDRRDGALALALQQGHIVYLFGALFVGIAYQPFIFMLIGIQVALVENVRRRLMPGKPRDEKRAMPLPAGAAPLRAP